MTRVEREQRGARTLDWGIAAALEQLGGLTSLWPADPLCAAPHFEHWHTSPSVLPRSDLHDVLIDLTNLTRQELRALCTPAQSLPNTTCVYVTFSDSRVLSLSFGACSLRAYTRSPLRRRFFIRKSGGVR